LIDDARVDLFGNPVVETTIANPYNYKLPPGFWREALAPTFLELLMQNRRILATTKMLSSETSRRFRSWNAD
jgi:hypothetical protein